MHSCRVSQRRIQTDLQPFAHAPRVGDDLLHARWRQFELTGQRGIARAFAMKLFDLGVTRAFPRHGHRSAEHTPELQSLMPISYAVFCLKKKITNKKSKTHNSNTQT